MGNFCNDEDRRVQGRIGMQVQLGRERRGLTVLALAELSGAHRNTIYRLECGRGCTVALLLRVMSILKLQTRDFESDALRLVHFPIESKKEK